MSVNAIVVFDVVSLASSSCKTVEPIDLNDYIFGNVTVRTIFSLHCPFDFSCQITELFKIEDTSVSKITD